MGGIAIKTDAAKISIPVILEVGRNQLQEIGKIVARTKLSNAVIFFGSGIYSLVGETICRSLKEQQIQILQQYEQDEPPLGGLLEFAFSIPPKAEMIIGVGGGKILDLAKYLSFLNDLPFISVPTSVSNDGFSSSGCSLFINRRRRSVPAKMPHGIIVDLDVIQNCPSKFIFSGIGDLVSKITALYDWEFEVAHGKAILNDFAVTIAKKSVNSLVRMDIKANIHEEFFLEELVDSLIMSGIAMEIAGNSAPASGSEHLISHSLDQLAQVPQLHGLQVGVATYLMSRVQEHRYPRVAKFLTETGFFEHVKGLGLKRADFSAAIEMAPEVKPHRYTYLHLPEYRCEAQRLLTEDPILREILV